MYVKAAEYAKLFKVHPQTLRRWAESGKVQFKWSPGGIRLYRLPDADQSSGEPVAEKKVVYARVSSSKQKDDLQRQADYLLSKFPGHRLVTDVGSGINWKRKGLLSLLDAANTGDLQELVVATRDRLCRFAFDLLQHIFTQRGVRLVVLDSADMSPEQELSDDLLSIVQIFCCRRNGKRRYSVGTANGAADEKDQAESNTTATGDAEPLCARRKVHV